jgi:pimeloyl-ACP methyl ester carboxylesterase
MPFVERPGGVKIFYNDTGAPTGPETSDTVLFFTHGFGSGSKMWEGQIPELSSFCRCVVWDMRGHAASDSPDDAALYNKQIQIDDMKAVLDACGVQKAVFLGHSMGAYDNMLFYLGGYQSYVQAFIFFGTGPGFSKPKGRIGWNEGAEKLGLKYETKGLDGLVGSDKTKGHRTAVGLMHSARKIFAQLDNDPLFVKFEQGASVAATSLKELTPLSLVLIGDRDKQFAKAADMMTAKLPSASKVLVEDAGHMANEKQPARFNAEVRKFLGVLEGMPKQLKAKL